MARAAGISASYLALIEGGRRPVNVALLARLAEALGVDPASLGTRGDAALLSTLGALAGEGTEDAAEFARRFPGWARLVATMSAERERDRDRIAALSDRMAHDPALAEAMHELLTTVASVRSTAAILAQTPELEPVWRERFHGNLDQESRRLASGAEAVVSYFDRGAEERAGLTPAEIAQSFCDARTWPELEEAGEGAEPVIAALVAELPEAARPLAAARLRREAEDARVLPLAALEGRDAAAIAARTGADDARVLRRLAATDPSLGLVACDAAGALLRRRPVPGFALPVIGAGCPLWPLFAAPSRPLHPIGAVVETPDGARWRVDAAAEVVGRGANGPILEATMLIARAAEGAGAAATVGPGCRVCPRAECPARREPPLVTTAAR
ncbi:short-chain fatty acyl-CoA regulator family protein [Jannaschia sp. W003]|uniref:short-chain fatty acyl-CoA regulator family protein n=1 Tax=Jannaschia sp. W003 TaxID=2867012 RepID=UPI0021A36274|nr:short-chain fatty acyl-CoA regulator family protein [Jannaschia sp. W003]